MTRTWVVATVLVLAGLTAVSGQTQRRVPSPRGRAATQVAGVWSADGIYSGGKWIDVEYGRPILRGRFGIFGAGDQYGKSLLIGAPLWRVGADQSTRITTEVDLVFGGKRLPAGRYTVFAETRPDEWTLIFSTYRAAQTYREQGLLDAAGFSRPPALWGAYGYTPGRDVLRVPMRLATVDLSADELIITFTNMTQQGGDFTVWWDDQMASTPFSVAP